MSVNEAWSTGNSQMDAALGLALLFLVAYVFRVYQLKRDTIHEALRALTIGAFVFAFCHYFLPEAGVQQGLATVLGIFGGCVVFGRRQKQGRYIPKETLRALEKRDLNGGSYDPEVHHIDHFYPYSKGGDTSLDNLRIIPKAENLKKGDKVPSVWDLLK